ncbi:MAG: helix-hairpin-helix domain-containing protein [Roseiflexaceae bacterium]
MMRQLWAWASNNLRLLIVFCFALSVIAFIATWLSFRVPASVSDDSQLQEQIDAPIDADLPGAPRSTDTPSVASTVIVYISGAVGGPDVYELPLDARIKDLVLAAGGLTADADPEQINLAGRLKDGDHVHVPRRGEAAAVSPVVGDTTDVVQSGPLDLNTASASDLDGLPGIGQSFAERIIEYRTSNGPFASVEDLQKVKGIGASLFAKIAPLVSVGP